MSRPLLDLHRVVRATRDVPAQMVTKGMVGTIIVIFERPAPAYEVEFVGPDGRTVLQATLTADEIEEVHVMTETRQVHKTTSELRNLLVQVMTHPTAPPEVIAAAADLVAADVRFNAWFLFVGKKTLSGDQLLDLLDTSEVTDVVQRAWLERDESNWSGVLEVLTSALARLRVPVA